MTIAVVLFDQIAFKVRIKVGGKRVLMASSIAILDYGFGNSSTVRQMLMSSGFESAIVQEPEQILSNTHLILPGVGNWSSAAEALQAGGWKDQIRRSVEDGAYVLGICLGMQLLGMSSEEGPGRGLELLPTVTRKLRRENNEPSTHVGWETWSERNTLDLSGRVYYSHGYCMGDVDDRLEPSYSSVFPTIVSSIRFKRIFGVQFHPERSLATGRRLLAAFARSELEA